MEFMSKATLYGEKPEYCVNYDCFHEFVDARLPHSAPPRQRHEEEHVYTFGEVPRYGRKQVRAELDRKKQIKAENATISKFGLIRMYQGCSSDEGYDNWLMFWSDYDCFCCD